MDLQTRLAAVLDNENLAKRLTLLARDINFFSRDERTALLLEAAKRIRSN